MSDSTDSTYWNLHCVSDVTVPISEWAGKEHNVLPLTADFSGGAPGWALGQQGYTFAADGTAFTFASFAA